MYLGTLTELEQKLQQLKYANQKLERNSRGSVFEGVHDHMGSVQRTGADSDAIVEETTLIRGRGTSAPSGAKSTSNAFQVLPYLVALIVTTLFL